MVWWSERDTRARSVRESSECEKEEAKNNPPVDTIVYALLTVRLEKVFSLVALVYMGKKVTDFYCLTHVAAQL